MTREEAIAYGKRAIDLGLNDETQAFCELAIKALEQEPCEDTISRQAAIDSLNEYFARIGKLKRRGLNKGEKAISLDTIGVIKTLPTVTPQPKIGQWRHYEGMLICPECGSEFYDDIMEYCGDDFPKCCPDCGAKMAGRWQKVRIKNDCNRNHEYNTRTRC